jgi:hypothetical protein
VVGRWWPRRLRNGCGGRGGGGQGGGGAGAPAWRSRGGGGAAGPWPAVGTVVEESALTNGGKHVDLDDRVREEGSEWGRGRARGFG